MTAATAVERRGDVSKVERSLRPARCPAHAVGHPGRAHAAPVLQAALIPDVAAIVAAARDLVSA
jgi:hypothetical protein